MEARKTVLKRLREDIVGPRSGFFEEIPERPSSRYLTGILFPQGATIGQDEDDEIDSTETGDEDGGGAEERVSLFRSFRPSTAGFSFAVRPGEEAPVIKIGARFAKYYLEVREVTEEADDGLRESGETTTAGETHRVIEAADVNENNIEEAVREDGSEEREKKSDSHSEREKKQKKRFWRREPKKARFAVDLLKGSGSESDEDGGLDCVWRVRKGKKLLLVTVQFVNPAMDADLSAVEREENTLFQFNAAAICENGAAFAERPQLIQGRDEDQEIADLIYRDVRDYAIGHTASAMWRPNPRRNPRSIHLTWMPRATVKQMDARGDPIIFQTLKNRSGTLHALELAFGSDENLINSVEAVCEAYGTWIGDESGRVSHISEERLQNRAKENLRTCQRACNRMREGAKLLADDPTVRQVFKLANLAIYLQSAWSKGYLEAQDHRPGDASIHEFEWRPFQIAFVLMCLGSTIDETHGDREIFDLIWFPTGGGKTEAYLLLVACILFSRRLRHDKEGAGVGAFMRYTLRTLTVQQFQRAAALITACELIRRKNPNLGETPFSIGLWVGSGSTPNNFKDAVAALADPYAESTPRQLKRCPVCKGPLSWYQNEDQRRIVCECQRKGCAGELPILTVDTDIYAAPPSLVIGTADKFAQIVRKKETGALFGIGAGRRPPDLVIQDELHLISGPLGSMAGLYEAAIDHLCFSHGHPPKVIGSTATIRRAAEQVRKIFDRDAFQFPPPAIDWSNSCFAKLQEDDPGRFYVGVTTAGRSEKFAMQATAASLLQSGFLATGSGEEPYKTLVAYFNSLKILGGAMVLMEDDVRVTVNSTAKSRSEAPRRPLRTPEELTSRKASSEIPEILERLGRPSSEEDFIDILLASNMLSVGVDIPRLGLMLMTGQPKSMSEYIQATSRVGRSHPGLVVTLYNNGKIRDRAHYEAFQVWHGALYRSVEPGSVTPFAPRARDKALHAPLVALALHLKNIAVGSATESDLDDISGFLLERIRHIDPEEEPAAKEDLERFIDKWSDLAASGQLRHYWNDKAYRSSLLMSAEEAAARRALGDVEILAQPTPNSLRNVEPGVTFLIKESSRDFNRYRGETKKEGEADA